ncbi:MAG: NAD(P) transhydrogenase subunit alpha [Acidobacteria bacterium]|nr:NAD(P) transhydrogenase subunit alpha [Acidobacteriota bacterium]
MTAGFVSEASPGERRVAMAPSAISVFNKTGIELVMETGSGVAAGFPDRDYTAKGVRLASRAEVFAAADVLLQVRSPGANPATGADDLALMRSGQTVIGLGEPLTAIDAARALAARGVSFLAMELMPRITRAQSMDALSSMATISGYKAVLLAADALPRMFPMLMTAAGTVAPAKVLVIGAGVAGLQAIATARRLGAVVSGYDIRSAVKEQIESLGARFIVLDVAAAAAEDKGGYAKAMGEDFYRRQREALGDVLAEQNVVITTAAVPGKRAPVLITAEMAARMAPGSVIVDIAAEHGGNCELTRPGETVEADGVRILGPLNLPSAIPYHASQMYARNIAAFLKYLVKDGKLALHPEDEIVKETLVTHAGEIVHSRIRELAG